MVVVGSFFVVSGGIHLRVRAPSSPARNTLFLLVGAVLANLVGTIGASMLLIRPWISMNKSRAGPMHIAFFIFLVSNIGGALLPVGPLILGISQRRAVLVDDATLLARMADYGRNCSPYIFCSRFH
jgi:Na+/H+ antiporter NhaD/arsenite permease-like protein